MILSCVDWKSKRSLCNWKQNMSLDFGNIRSKLYSSCNAKLTSYWLNLRIESILSSNSWQGSKWNIFRAIEQTSSCIFWHLYSSLLLCSKPHQQISAPFWNRYVDLRTNGVRRRCNRWKRNFSWAQNKTLCSGRGDFQAERAGKESTHIEKEKCICLMANKTRHHTRDHLLPRSVPAHIHGLFVTAH